LCVDFSHFGICPFQRLGLLRVQGLELLLLVEFPVLLLFLAAKYTALLVDSVAC